MVSPMNQQAVTNYPNGGLAPTAGDDLGQSPGTPCMPMVGGIQPPARSRRGGSMRNSLYLSLSVLSLLGCNACSIGPTEKPPEASPTTTVGANPTLPKPEKK